jgi:hypothetical protein
MSWRCYTVEIHDLINNGLIIFSGLGFILQWRKICGPNCSRRCHQIVSFDFTHGKWKSTRLDTDPLGFCVGKWLVLVNCGSELVNLLGYICLYSDLSTAGAFSYEAETNRNVGFHEIQHTTAWPNPLDCRDGLFANESFKVNESLLSAVDYTLAWRERVVRLVNDLPHSSPRERCSTHFLPCPQESSTNTKKEGKESTRERVVTSSLLRSSITRSLRQLCTSLPKWITFTTISSCMKLYIPNNLFFNYSYFIKYTIFNVIHMFTSRHFQLFSIVIFTDIPSFIIYLT